MAGIPSESGGAPAALDELCDLIVTRYHDAFRRDVPLIDALIRRLAGSGPRAVEIMAHFGALAAALEAHMAKEENILFPAFRSLAEAARHGRERPALPFPTVLHPIRAMESEHARMDGIMDRLRWTTAGFTVPDDGGEDWRQACRALGAFDLALVEHARLANHVLFPLALDVERTLF